MTYSAINKNMLVLGICSVVVFNFHTAMGLSKCLRLDVSEVKNVVFYESKKLNLTIQTSNRPTHKLTSHIFKIFLEEVVEYSNVKIVEMEDYFDAEKVIETLTGNYSEEHVKSIPDVMINLEVWVPQDLDTISILRSHNVLDYGSVRSPGRFGWFIPKKLTQAISDYDSKWMPEIGDVLWAFFKDKNFASSFHILEKERLLGSLTESTETSNKDSHTYIPERCKGKETKCATLLAPTYVNTSFLVQQIDTNNMYVEVVWLGQNLRKAYKKVLNHYKINNLNRSIVVMAWTPSDIIYPESDFTSVVFKNCEHGQNSFGCKYDMMRLQKFIWSKLESYAKPAADVIREFKFSDNGYQDLLKLYEDHDEKDTYEDMACRWLKKNEFARLSWYQRKTKKDIYIGGIFPITGSSYNGGNLVASARRALALINANKSILREYSLHLLVADGQCRADKVMRSFINYVVEVNYYQKMVGVLGPACSDTVEPLAGVSKIYKTLVISYAAEGASFSDRDKYPYFFRTISSNSEFKYVYLKLLQKLEWRRVAALTEDGQKYTEYISHTQNLLESHGITFIANAKFPRERKSFAMTKYLEDLKKKRAKIIIADVFDEVARTVMCEAYRLKMTMRHGYVWFLPAWLHESWYDTDYFNKQLNESVNCSTSNMIDAIDGYFSITPAFWGPPESTTPENITVSKWVKDFNVSKNGHVSDYAGFAYDAIWTYAYALDEVLKEDPGSINSLNSLNTTTKLVRYIENKIDFNGVSGRINFRGGSSRYSNIHLNQWVRNRNRTTVGIFKPNVSDTSPEILDGVLDLNSGAIEWLSGSMPDDGTLPPETCSLDTLAKSLGVGCEMAIVILCFMIFSIIIIGIGTWLVLYKRKVDSKIVETQNFMKSLGLGPDGIAISDLDKWEIPRENVVINRKLGEGAFGTVYGGEALITDKGWIAVAVKTLKVGSSVEEKIDFLTEAEAMKKFKHKNIVELIGVIINSEPVYTIMEFMLYGDLKTYLLARRNLVNQRNSDENDEVSNKKLTSMALDVARALSYLADMKYVHRDVACRNCLVHSNRVVKLGDFGMTRAMYDNDYYRLIRKTILPVRWMAPESLTLGVFTPGSDVWSYGVLLYEIITFGSFPFQGMSNSQVLDYVKQGNKLDVPKGVKPQLEMLLKSCWNEESKKRPAASEIVEFLANNPILISPCLDGPTAAVAMEGSDEFQVHLPHDFRKTSTATFKNTMFTTNDAEPSLIDFNDKPHLDLTQDSGFPVHGDAYCPREPLLAKATTPNTGLSYVTISHLHSQPNLFDGEEFSRPPKPANGYIVS